MIFNVKLSVNFTDEDMECIVSMAFDECVPSWILNVEYIENYNNESVFEHLQNGKSIIVYPSDGSDSQEFTMCKLESGLQKWLDDNNEWLIHQLCEIDDGLGSFKFDNYEVNEIIQYAIYGMRKYR